MSDPSPNAVRTNLDLRPDCDRYNGCIYSGRGPLSLQHFGWNLPDEPQLSKWARFGQWATSTIHAHRETLACMGLLWAAVVGPIVSGVLAAWIVLSSVQ